MHARNSKYWRDKADEELKRVTKGKPCEVCASQGHINTASTCGHHLIAKARSGLYRHSYPHNIVILCQSHHTMGNTLAAHSKSMAVMDAFIEWMKTNKPDQYAWAKEHNYDKGDIDYEAAYYALKDIT